MLRPKRGHVHKPAGRCARCNHHIWLPESLEAGLGKICRSKLEDEEVSQSLQAEYKKLVREILDLQKKGKVYKAKVHSNRALWLKNKKLVEGW